MTAPTQQYTNDGQTTLAAGITPASLALSVAAGTGALFPNPNVGNQFFLVTLIDEATGGIKEIVRCTQRVGDIMTIVRGQEGTDPVAWSAGDLVKMLLTAGTMENMIQIPQAQAQTFKFAQDTGGVNSVVVALSPAVTTRIQGLEINVKIAANNMGDSTLNLGAGSIQIVNPDGSALGSGALVAGGVATFIDTGSGPYQLISASQELQTVSGLATTGQIQWRPTNELVSGWVKANGGTVGNTGSGASLLAGASASNLFAWCWNNFSNTQCPVQDSAGNPVARGANAAADFAANRRIVVIDLRGIAMVGYDGGSGKLTGVPVVSGGVSTPGSIVGENLHILTAGQIPTITANGTNTINVASSRGDFGYGVTSSATGGGDFPFNPVVAYTQVVSSGSNNIAVTSNNTGGQSHNNVGLAMIANPLVKL
ncbi:hypothetical protein EDE08_103524 [Bradyrhizobium sp. R2.2-H]|uniref:hypothetical protein n=1 Tax=unclassified Bradyrhizobium TaxID=2631580 RepID=UPI00104B9BD4|nr:MULTISPECIES: hypothetical protein [unclassified Bradyrhizobium]TCU75304.1 hypothetical protein EDE10_103523 [Bradyrhizobium sp. Y-H1]TCU78072.1 hypothetical protein EDE08_103524 [Bradyrhizobium sp. R2.2-H]